MRYLSILEIPGSRAWSAGTPEVRLKAYGDYVKTLELQTSREPRARISVSGRRKVPRSSSNDAIGIQGDGLFLESPFTTIYEIMNLSSNPRVLI